MNDAIEAPPGPGMIVFACPASYNIAMTQSALNRSLKQAIAQGLHDNRDALRDLLAEVIEDVAMASAIREGLKTKPVTRSAVYKALSGRK